MIMIPFKGLDKEDEIQAVLNSAKAYVELAAGNLVKQAPPVLTELDERSPDSEEDLFSHLKIHFLFPNLTGEERAAMTDLAIARNSLLCDSTTDRFVRNKGSGVESLAETRFLAAKAIVDSLALAGKMSPIQQAIFEREYYCLPQIDPRKP